jgi:hypothetical protein
MSKLLNSKKLCQLSAVLWDVYCSTGTVFGCSYKCFGCRCIWEQHELYSWRTYRALCAILLYLSNKCTVFINNVCFLKHCYIFWCLYFILRQFLMYAKVTELLKWQLLYKLLLQIISRLKSSKHCTVCQIVYDSFTVRRTLLCGWWLCVQLIETCGLSAALNSEILQ